jgi:hypothetical protein
VVSCQMQISNAVKYPGPCRDANLVYAIEIIIDCEFLIICKRLIMSSVLRFGGNAVEAI